MVCTFTRSRHTALHFYLHCSCMCDVV
jgi:hypothetical protein